MITIVEFNERQIYTIIIITAIYIEHLKTNIIVFSDLAL